MECGVAPPRAKGRGVEGRDCQYWPDHTLGGEGAKEVAGIEGVDAEQPETGSCGSQREREGFHAVLCLRAVLAGGWVGQGEERRAGRGTAQLEEALSNCA